MPLQAPAPPENPAVDGPPEATVLRCDQLVAGELRALLGGFGLELVELAEGAEIPGSFWGAPEAGIIGDVVYVRPDTPVHSALHEGCHLVCAGERRGEIHTDAGGDYAEEDAVCYLQIVLAERLTGVGAGRLLADMDAWGYTFRLGSARAWFEGDAEDAAAWLRGRGLPAGLEAGLQAGLEGAKTRIVTD